MKKAALTILVLCLTTCGYSQNQLVAVRFPSIAIQGATSQTVVKNLPFPSYPSGQVTGLFTGVSGGTGCTLTVQFFSGSTFVTTAEPFGPGQTLPSGSGTLSWRVGTNPNVASNLPFLGFYSSALIQFACSVFPTAGTAVFEFEPDYNQPTYFPFHISSNTSSTLKTIPAELHTLTINNAGSAETITIFDNAGTCSGTTLAVITGLTTGTTFTFDVMTQTGLCITTSGTTAGDYTASFR
jgi:hypothetical protein